jgi:hypothetical protein
MRLGALVCDGRLKRVRMVPSFRGLRELLLYSQQNDNPPKQKSNENGGEDEPSDIIGPRVCWVKERTARRRLLKSTKLYNFGKERR